MNFLKRHQRWLRWALTLTLLGYVATRINLRQLAERLGQADSLWVTVSALLSVGVVALMGARWREVLRACDIAVPLSQTVSVTFIGQFFNSFLPGSTGGDVVKAWHSAQWAPDRKAAPAVSIVYDRLTAIVTMLLVTAVILAFQASQQPELRWLFERFAGLALIALLGVAVLAIAARALLRQALAKLTGDHPIQKFLHRHLHHCQLAPDAIRHFLTALGISIPTHLVNVAAAWCVARAVQLDVTAAQVAVAVAFVNFSSVLPVSIGGHGLREAGFLFIFGLYGLLPPGAGHDLAFEKVIAFSILFYARSLISSLPGGWCYAAFRRTQRASQPAPNQP